MQVVDRIWQRECRMSEVDTHEEYESVLMYSFNLNEQTSIIFSKKKNNPSKNITLREILGLFIMSRIIRGTFMPTSSGGFRRIGMRALTRLQSKYYCHHSFVLK